MSTERISIATDGSEGSRGNYLEHELVAGPYLSYFNLHVVFSTGNAFSALDDNDGDYDVYLRDRATGETILVSATPDGHAGNGASEGAGISAYGELVAFLSEATDLVPDTEGAISRVYLRDIDDGQTTMVRFLDDGGTGGDAFITGLSMSGDGNYLAVESIAALTPNDSDTQFSITLHDVDADTNVLVSRDMHGDGADGSSFYPVMSLDGSKVLFMSNATNLVEDDTNDQTDLFLYDRQTDSITRVNVSSSGEQANGEMEIDREFALSLDGTRIVFTSEADNLVEGDTNGQEDVFLHDTSTGETILVSRGMGGESGNDSSDEGTISLDGRYVLFESRASDLVNDDLGEGLFRYDADTGEITRFYTGEINTHSISMDGQLALFETSEALVVGDENASRDIFLYASNSAELVSIGDDESVGLDASLPAPGDSLFAIPVMSEDASRIVFTSDADNLVAGDDNALRDVFVRDRSSGETLLVSVDHEGGAADGASEMASISNDGTKVLFRSDATDLVAGDTNGAADLFVRDLEAGTTTILAQDGGWSYGSWGVATISGDGTKVAFSTSEALSLVDGNDAADIYVMNLATGDLTLASVNAAGTAAGNSFSEAPILSDDGSRVLFWSFADDLAGADLGAGRTLYLRDFATDTTHLVNQSTDGEFDSDLRLSPGGEAEAGGVAMSGDGNIVAFTSGNRLVEEDDNWVGDIFVRNVDEGTTIRVSVASDGSEADGNSWAPSISGDGRYVQFQSDATNLVSDGQGGGLFRHDLENGSTVRVSTGTFDAPQISDDGTLALVGTSDLLTVGDFNAVSDLYLLNIQIPQSDPPVVTPGPAVPVAEDATGLVHGVVTAMDPDAEPGEVITFTIGNGTYGTATIDQTGKWSYDLDQTSETVQSLAAGEHMSDFVTVTATDPFGAAGTAQVEIIIRGSNDLPVVSGNTGTMLASSASTTGTLVVTDIDVGDETEFTVAGQGSHGTFDVDPDGSWTYTLGAMDPTVMALPSGESTTDSIGIRATDDYGGVTTSTLTVTINGVNDAPVVGSDSDAVSVASPSAEGSVSVFDYDTGDQVALSASEGAYGTFTINQDGTWSYALDADNADVHGLGTGESLTETITVTGTDTGAQIGVGLVSITINGGNRAPDLSGTTSGIVDEDATGTIRGSVTASDLDGDTPILSVSDGTHGTAVIDAQGRWVYDLDEGSEVIQALPAGENLTDTITVTASDGQGGSSTMDVTITIEGRNDLPVVQGNEIELDADGEGTASGGVLFSDIDTTDTVTFTGGEATYGTVTFQDDSSWSYVLDKTNASVLALDVGETLTEEIDLTATDNWGGIGEGQLTITINGVNDGPVVVGSGSPIGEDDAEPISGQLTVTDPEQHAFELTAGEGAYGSFTLEQDGSWSYQLDTAQADVQALVTGETMTDTVTVTATDEHGAVTEHDLTFTINGDGIAPTLADLDPAELSLEQGPSHGMAFGQAMGNAVDPAGEVTFAISEATYGTATIDETGGWVYDIDWDNLDYRALPWGESLTETLTITVKDAEGQATSKTLTITLPGVNDAPVPGEVGPYAVTEGQTLTVDAEDGVLVGATDPEGESLSAILVAGPSHISDFTLNQDGSFSYAATSNTILALAQGETLTDSFTYTISDGEESSLTQTASITITGVAGGYISDAWYDNLPTIGQDPANTVGTNENDTLTGTKKLDNLYGGAGDDILIGGRKTDHLIGGSGDDTMTGGRGKDFFYLNKPGEGVDSITDFQTNRDKLVLDDILDGYTPQTASSFIRLTTSGGNTTIALDADGAQNGSSFTDVAVLRGVSTTLDNLIAKNAIQVE